MIIKYLKVLAVDTYKKSPNYNKRVEFIVEDNELGKERLSFYTDIEIIDSWEEDIDKYIKSN